MERAGVRVDAGALKAYGDELGVRIRELETKIYEEAGETFNINSPKQLGGILFDKLGMKGGKKTKTGYSTSAEVLEKLAPEHPIVADILEYRQLAKLKSTYADGLAVYIGEDGRIHTTFQQTITATGRLSSVEPNLQNIPIRMELGRRIRKVFIPKEGCGPGGRGLLPDRAAGAGPYVGRREPDPGLPGGAGYPQAYGLPGVSRALR